jgi:hypothetical protein
MPTKEKTKNGTQTSKIEKNEEIVSPESEETMEDEGGASPESQETKADARGISRQLSREELEALRHKLQKRFH